MKFARRQFLRLAASAGALPIGNRLANAQAYPARPVRIIVPVAAGGATDILGRLLAQWLSDRMGQPFVVENRPGAGGNIGTEMALRAAPDGYTLLLIQAGNVINTSLYNNLSFNFPRDAAAVVVVSRPPFMMSVHPSVPAKTIPEFIAHVSANPGKVNMASAGSARAIMSPANCSRCIPAYRWCMCRIVAVGPRLSIWWPGRFK